MWRYPMETKQARAIPERDKQQSCPGRLQPEDGGSATQTMPVNSTVQEEDVNFRSVQ